MPYYLLVVLFLCKLFLTEFVLNLYCLSYMGIIKNINTLIGFPPLYTYWVSDLVWRDFPALHMHEVKVTQYALGSGYYDMKCFGGYVWVRFRCYERYAMKWTKLHFKSFSCCLQDLSFVENDFERMWYTYLVICHLVFNRRHLLWLPVFSLRTLRPAPSPPHPLPPSPTLLIREANHL